MAGKTKILAIVLIVTLVAGLLAAGGWASYEGIQLYKRKQTRNMLKNAITRGGPVRLGAGGYSGLNDSTPSFQPTTGPNPPSPFVSASAAPQPDARRHVGSGALDSLGAGRMRSNRATGYDSDLSNSCMNENLVGSIQAPLSDRAGNMRPSFPSAPMGGKPIPLGSSKISNNSNKHGSLGRTSSVDLSGFARMGMDRAIGAQGLDDPAELALASVMLGHIEAA